MADLRWVHVEVDERWPTATVHPAGGEVPFAVSVPAELVSALQTAHADLARAETALAAWLVENRWPRVPYGDVWRDIAARDVEVAACDE